MDSSTEDYNLVVMINVGNFFLVLNYKTTFLKIIYTELKWSVI